MNKDFPFSCQAFKRLEHAAVNIDVFTEDCAYIFYAFRGNEAFFRDNNLYYIYAGLYRYLQVFLYGRFIFMVCLFERRNAWKFSRHFFEVIYPFCDYTKQLFTIVSNSPKIAIGRAVSEFLKSTISYSQNRR